MCAQEIDAPLPFQEMVTSVETIAHFGFHRIAFEGALRDHFMSRSGNVSDLAYLG
jgi:hypothetical protein